MAKPQNNFKAFARINLQRFLSSFILFIIIAAALVAGKLGLTLLLATIIVIGSGEWCKLTRITQRVKARRFMVFSLLFSLLILYLGYAYAAFGWLFLATSVMMFMSWLTWRRGFFWLGVGILYIGLPTASCFALMILFEKFIFVFMWCILIVVANDTGAYVTGTLVGGKKLAPKISPHKTWAGLIGGLAFVLGFAWVYQYLGFFDMPKPLYFISSFCLGVVSVLGDLLESGIKRYHGSKDSGELIPGHGGLLDRLDGFFVTLPFMALMVFLQPKVFDQALPDEKEMTVLLENDVKMD